MSRINWLLIIPCFLAWPVQADNSEVSWSKLLAGEHRSESHQARDTYRHPEATLSFFQVQPSHTVVEIWPGAGWYTEILAPLLKTEGHLIAAHFPKQTDVGFYRRMRAKFSDKLKRDDIYESVVMAEFHPPSQAVLAPSETVDRLLTFRNVHNWLKAGFADEAFMQFFEVLKPGGILGVVEHRALPGTDLGQMIKSGYVTEALVIQLAEQAGFVLDEKSELNANPKDDTIHPKGVWTLPPSLRLGDIDREIYQNIGESDRMTLRFIKP